MVVDEKETFAESNSNPSDDALQEAHPAEASEWTTSSILTIIGAFCSLFISVGFMNAWGVWQEYYQKHQLKDRSEFDIAWIGSFATFVLMFGGGLAGFLVDKVGPTPLLASACTAVILGIFMTSLCEQYWQFFLAQGLLTGLAMSFLTIPCISTLALHFTKHRGLATGLAIAGSSFGGVIWPIVDDQLLNHRGMSFAWTMRVNGFIAIPLAIVVTLSVRRPSNMPLTKKSPSGPSTAEQGSKTSDQGNLETQDKRKSGLAILKRPVFILFAAGASIFNLGMFSPFFFTTAYSVHLGHGASFAFYTLSAMNASSLFGRILIGILADRFGAFNLTTISALVGAVVCYCWTAATSQAEIMVWALAYGFSSGAILSLQMHCATAISTKETFGTVLGVAFGSCSVASVPLYFLGHPNFWGLVGSPISGELLPHGFLALSMYAASTLLVGGLFLIAARLCLNQKLMVKV